ncbi:YLR254C [Saccharomyces arboricola H-6]|uniref:YLR254C n=1 Tax=Saccharomyces arboricola (strain H-6 / AS 2.3317 / CBS 10644) TaxID=1160507 RepID=J8PYS9_SACAR|nr:YLR254C [Saccharomyces arboricola H-6]
MVPNLDLETAVQIISSLETQLSELETATKEYESDLEQVISNLRNEVLDCHKQGKRSKKQITGLEIQVDELENENAQLRNKIEALQLESDRRLERNVLLEHELVDTKDALQRLKVNKEEATGSSEAKRNTGPLASQNKKIKLFKETIKVSTTCSTLYLQNMTKNSSAVRSHCNIPNTQITQSTVIATTSSV